MQEFSDGVAPTTDDRRGPFGVILRQFRDLRKLLYKSIDTREN